LGPLLGRLPRGRPWVAVAIGVVVVIAVGLWNLVLQSENAAKNNTLKRVETVLQCVDDPACTQVRLTKRTDPTPRGVVLVRGDRATVVVDGLDPNQRGSTTYVLWQVPADTASKSLPIAAFDVTCRTVCVVELRHPLRLTLGSTREFLISLEASPKGWQQLDDPSTAVAVGEVQPS
jgi:hypothetical protein